MTDPTGTRAASPREVVERLHRLVLDNQIEAQVDLFAPDGVLEWPFAPAGVPRRLQGREEIRRVLAALRRRLGRTRLTGLDAVRVHQTLDPEVVVVELEAHGRDRSTGGTYRLPYIQVARVRDGAIVSFRDYFGGGTARALVAALEGAEESGGTAA